MVTIVLQQIFPGYLKTCGEDGSGVSPLSRLGSLVEKLSQLSLEAVQRRDLFAVHPSASSYQIEPGSNPGVFQYLADHTTVSVCVSQDQFLTYSSLARELSCCQRGVSHFGCGVGTFFLLFWLLGVIDKRPRQPQRHKPRSFPSAGRRDHLQWRPESESA